jgi:hypothetical protein
MDHGSQNKAFHLLRRVSRPALEYLLAGTDEAADESFLVRPDILDAASYTRITHSVSGNFSFPPTTAVQSINEAFFIPLFYDDDGTLVPTSPEAEIARLVNAAGTFSKSCHRDTFDEVQVTNGDGFLSSDLLAANYANSGDAVVALHSASSGGQRVVPFPGLGCDLLLDDASLVLRRNNPCYAGVCGARSTSSTSAGTLMMLGRYVTDLITGDSVILFRYSNNIVHVVCVRQNGLNRKERFAFLCKRESVQNAFRNGHFYISADAMIHVMHFSQYRQCPVCGAPAADVGCSCTQWQTFHDAMLRPKGLRNFSRMVSEGVYKSTARELTVDPDTTAKRLATNPAYFCRPVQIDTIFPLEDTLSLSDLLLHAVQNRLAANVPAPAGCTSTRMELRTLVEQNFDVEIPDQLVELHSTSLTDPKLLHNVSTVSLEPMIEVYGGGENSEGLYPGSSGGHFEPPNSSTAPGTISRSQAFAMLFEEKERKAYARKLRNRVSALKSNEKRRERYNNLVADVQNSRILVFSLREREKYLLAENMRLTNLVKSGGPEAEFKRSLTSG